MLDFINVQHFQPQPAFFLRVPHFSASAGILKETNNQVESFTESARNDVDQDVFLMFNVVDENLSWYADENIEKCADPGGVDPEDADFMESNLMHGRKSVGFTQIFLILKRLHA